MTAPKPKRPWFQFSVRTLLIVVTLCAIACSWFAVKMREAKRQRQAAEAIEKLDGRVVWDCKSSERSDWLRSLLGDDFFESVLLVNITNPQVTDAELEHLKDLSQLRQLWLTDTQVTDAGLEHLKGLSQLKRLGLDNTKVTGAGLEHLKGLSQLQVLLLENSQVTDAGLENLKGLSQVQVLRLNNTQVTDAGLEHLKGLS